MHTIKWLLSALLKWFDFWGKGYSIRGSRTGLQLHLGPLFTFLNTPLWVTKEKARKWEQSACIFYPGTLVSMCHWLHYLFTFSQTCIRERKVAVLCTRTPTWLSLDSVVSRWQCESCWRSAGLVGTLLWSVTGRWMQRRWWWSTTSPAILPSFCAADRQQNK